MSEHATKKTLRKDGAKVACMVSLRERRRGRKHGCSATRVLPGVATFKSNRTICTRANTTRNARQNRRRLGEERSRYTTTRESSKTRDCRQARRQRPQTLRVTGHALPRAGRYPQQSLHSKFNKGNYSSGGLRAGIWSIWRTHTSCANGAGSCPPPCSVRRWALQGLAASVLGPLGERG